MSDKPYRLPNPKDNPAAFLVLFYKTMKRVEFNDRGWDKIYFARCMKRMQQLLDNLGGDVQACALCMEELKSRFENEMEVDWTIETVIKYSFDWRAENQKKTDRECLKNLLGAYSSVLGTKGLQAADPSDVLKRLLAIQSPGNGGASHVNSGTDAKGVVSANKQDGGDSVDGGV